MENARIFAVAETNIKNSGFDPDDKDIYIKQVNGIFSGLRGKSGRSVEFFVATTELADMGKDFQAAVERKQAAFAHEGKSSVLARVLKGVEILKLGELGSGDR